MNLKARQRSMRVRRCMLQADDLATGSSFFYGFMYLSDDQKRKMSKYSGAGALGAERGTSFGPHAIFFFLGLPPIWQLSPRSGD